MPIKMELKIPRHRGSVMKLITIKAMGIMVIDPIINIILPL